MRSYPRQSVKLGLFSVNLSSRGVGFGVGGVLGIISSVLTALFLPSHASGEEAAGIPFSPI